MAFNFDIHSLSVFAKDRRVIVTAGLLTGILAYRWNVWKSHRAINNNEINSTWDKEKEIVLITGGSGGIGAEIVKGFVAKKVKIINVDVFPPAGPSGPNQHFYELDITSTADIKAVAEQIRAEHGHPTVIINNAGIGAPSPILGLPESRLRAIFDVNIIAHFHLLSEFLPWMIENNHGHIVTVASMASYATQAGNVPYACTKAAAMALHEGLSQELRHVYKSSRVRTSVVHPSWVRTALIQDLTESGAWKESTLEPADVATAIVRQVCSGFGDQVILPSSMWWVPGLRVFPLWLQEGMRDSLSKVLLTVL